MNSLNSFHVAGFTVPVVNGHPRDQAKVPVHCRWLLIRGNLTLKCIGRGIDNVAVQGRWPLTTGVAQGRYYCISISICFIVFNSISFNFVNSISFNEHFQSVLYFKFNQFSCFNQLSCFQFNLFQCFKFNLF